MPPRSPLPDIRLSGGPNAGGRELWGVSPIESSEDLVDNKVMTLAIQVDRLTDCRHSVEMSLTHILMGATLGDFQLARYVRDFEIIGERDEWFRRTIAADSAIRLPTSGLRLDVAELSANAVSESWTAVGAFERLGGSRALRHQPRIDVVSVMTTGGEVELFDRNDWPLLVPLRTNDLAPHLATLGFASDATRIAIAAHALVTASVRAAMMEAQIPSDGLRVRTNFEEDLHLETTL